MAYSDGWHDLHPFDDRNPSPSTRIGRARTRPSGNGLSPDRMAYCIPTGRRIPRTRQVRRMPCWTERLRMKGHAPASRCAFAQIGAPYRAIRRTDESTGLYASPGRLGISRHGPVSEQVRHPPRRLVDDAQFALARRRRDAAAPAGQGWCDRRAAQRGIMAEQVGTVKERSHNGGRFARWNGAHREERRSSGG